MKKVINIVKKMFISIGVFLFSVSTKVLAAIEPAYGVRNLEPDLYGPPRTTNSSIPAFWKIARSFVIPIAFLIGVIVYFKKSKSSTKRKIITSIIALILLFLICFGINYLITNI